MSQPYRFSLLGDSNILRHVNKNSCRANPLVKKCQVIQCGRVEIFSSSLESVRAESEVCIISCISNFLTDSEGPVAVSHRVDPVLQMIRAALVSSCAGRPTLMHMLAPPMYRTTPIWYREGMSEILTLFSQMMSSERPDNLLLLPSFPTPEYDPDGVHLTPYSGLEFVMHLFDSSEELMGRLALEVGELTSKNVESNRALEDRVVALEQDHRRLVRVVDDKVAIDAEMADFLKNERFEDCFVVEGTPRIPDDVVGKPWQDRAIRDVQKVLKILMGKPGNIVFIQIILVVNILPMLGFVVHLCRKRPNEPQTLHCPNQMVISLKNSAMCISRTWLKTRFLLGLNHQWAFCILGNYFFPL